MAHKVSPHSDVVRQVLYDPMVSTGFGPQEWSRLLQQARQSGMLVRIAERLGHLSQEEPAVSCPSGARPSPGPVGLPSALCGHVESAQRLSAAQRAEITRESMHLLRALNQVDTPVVLLKGAAYVMAGLPAATGRVFSDLDVMVRKSALPQVESALMLHGWMSTHHNAYDQRYYREWMHELPPMQHVHRRTTLDVHHTILPETARFKPDAALLLQASVPIAGWPGLRMLAPQDMVLHSMTHLFMNDDMSNALRDLYDIDVLVRHFAQDDAQFWQHLVGRAQQLDLVRPLYYGLTHAQALLRTPLPATIDHALQAMAAPAPLRNVMNALWNQALSTPTASKSVAQSFALWALYVRAHWLRMPPLLLARHLTIKALGLHRRSGSGPQPQP